ncbi:helix-turn-helix domain-containing protein [Micromonospora sp. DR5-3]|uniref:PucR family transcriptional regulator n=1 Tax=unclassified Micromonospora TaxID=2617518 RepID=UPI0011DA4F05|nr:MULTISPECIES: helix-turn-helix domain-containing protein [unclassified Micromonospora]MCW3820420.1 helix-turn-helix domain-containing protein [Micromonospora sp. DR5-3]TYC19455.1 PucR family transcriptional regulator [Micromonospora sp. MP36]
MTDPSAMAFDGRPDPDPQHLTVGRLLQERLLRQARTAASADLLDTAVSWCLPLDEVQASDDPLPGVVVHARADQVRSALLPDLGRRNAAALVVAGEADVVADPSCGLPVIHVGAHVAFRQLSELVAELVLARDTHVLRYGLRVHRALVELLYRGAGLAALGQQMARLSGCTAAILDPQYRVLAFERSRDRLFESASVADALRGEAPGEAADPRPAARGAAGLDVVAQPHAGPQVRRLLIDGISATCVLNPILLGGRHDGWVLIVESADPPSPHEIAQHRVVVEQAATIVGTEMLRMRSVEQAQERARGDFVHALLHGRFSNQHELEARAAHYDFPVGATYGVVVANGLGSVGSPDSPTALFQLARHAARLDARPNVHTLATVVGDVLAVVRQVDPAGRRDSPDAQDRALADFARALQADLERRTQRRVAVAYGRCVGGAGRIFDSYREARIALGIRNRLGMDQVCGFQDLRVFAALAELAESPQGQAFARDLLAPLRGSRAGGNGLEEAVIAYVASGGNLNAAARELHIHRNTMLYKLDRASRLLQLDLRDAEHQFAVWLAHKLNLLAETMTAVDRDLSPT